MALTLVHLTEQQLAGLSEADLVALLEDGSDDHGHLRVSPLLVIGFEGETIFDLLDDQNDVGDKTLLVLASVKGKRKAG